MKPNYTKLFLRAKLFVSFLIVWQVKLQAQLVNLTVLQTDGQATYTGSGVFSGSFTAVKSGTPSSGCNGANGTTPSAATMGRASGLTITLTPSSANSNVAWGLDLSKFIYSYANNTANAISTISYSSRMDCNGADDVAPWDPETNMFIGKIVLRGSSSVTYSNGGPQTVPLRYVITVTAGGNPLAVRRNGNIVYIPMAQTTVVNIKAQVDATYLTNRSAIWIASCAGHTGWQPALTIFDDLATGAGGIVQSAFQASWYDASTNYPVSVTLPSGVTQSQSPASVVSPWGVTNTGIEISGRAGGITYTLTNTNNASGSTANCYGFGFDPASGLGYSFANGNNTQDGFIASINNISETNLSTGLVYAYGGTNVTYARTAGGNVTATIGFRYILQFMNGSNAAIPVKWRDGKIFVAMPNNGGSVVKVNIKVEVNVNDLYKDRNGTAVTPVWHGGGYSGSSGWQPALTVYDYLATTGSNAITNVNIQYYTLPLPDNTITVTENSGVDSDDAITCPNFTSALAAVTGYTYLWSTTEATRVISPAPSVTTAYTVTLTESTFGCRSTGAKTITVTAKPTSTGVTISPNPVCSNSTATISANAAAGSGTISSYLWSSGVTPNNAAIGSVSAAGTYSVIVTNSNVCTAQFTSPVLVVTPEQTVNAGPAATSICGNLTYTANSATASNYTSILWSHNGTGSFDDNTIFNTTYTPGPGETGVVTLTLTAYGNSPCVPASDNIALTIHAVPAFTTLMSPVLCYGGNSGSIAVTVTTGLSLFDFSNNNGFSYTLNQASPYSFTGLTAGGYSIVVRDANDCISSPVTVNVTEPAAAVSVTASNGGPYSTGMTANLYSTPAGGTPPYTFNWNGPASFGSHPQHVFEDPIRSPSSVVMTGTYNITVTDANGCTANASTTMHVYDGYVWGGSVSTDWNNPLNWIHSGVSTFPDNCTRNAIIPGGTVFNPTVNIAGLTIGKLTLVNGAIVNLTNDLATCSDLQGSATALVSQINGPAAFIMQGTSPSVTQKISGKTRVDILRIDNSGIGAEVVYIGTQINTALELKQGNLKVANADWLTFLSTSTAHCAVFDNFSAGFTGTFMNGLNGSLCKAQRYYASTTANSYFQHFMSSPMKDMNLGYLAMLSSPGDGGYLIDLNCREDVLTPGSPQGNVLQYNEVFGSNCSLEGYEVVTSATPVAVNGKGYSIRRLYAPGTISVNGTPNINPAGYPQAGLTNSGWSNLLIPSNTIVGSGSWLVGNPYLASLDLANPGAVSTTGMNSEVHVWNTQTGSYDVYMIGTHNPIPIAPFQGFWMVTSGGTGSVTVTGAARSRTAAPTFQQTGNDQELEIHVNNTSTGLSDKTVVNFNQSATAQFDSDKDAHKYSGAYTRHTLYTMGNGEMLSINTLKSINETSTVDMGFYPGVNGTYEMTFNGISSFDPTSYIMLEDKLTNTWHNVRNGNYTYTSNTGGSNDRFVLHFTPAAILSTANSGCAGEGQINIEQPGTANWNYTVADNSNTIISSGTLNQSSPIQLSVNAGVYTVTLTDNNNYTVVKQLQVIGASPITANFSSSKQTAEEEEVISFNNTTANATSTIWNMGDGTTYTTANTTHQYQSEGSYTVTLTVTNADGCTDTKTQTITVTAKEEVISNINHLTGRNGITMWSHGKKVFVDFSQQKIVEANIEIYNILGQQLVNDKFAKASIYSKDLQNLEAAYIIVRVNNNGELTTRKLFVTSTK